MEFVTTVFGKGFEMAVDQVKRYSNHTFRYQKNIEKLKRKRETLKVELAAKKRSVRAAEIKGDEIVPRVEEWLREVERKTREAEERHWSDKEQEAQKKCLFNMFPNFRSRYLFSKKAVKEMEDLDDLLREGQSFLQISHPSELDIPSTLYRGCETLGSRKVVLDAILSAAADPMLNVIGVYGAAGVGKTTLVKEVMFRVREQKLFDAVVMAVVSCRPEIRKVQEQIADFFGIKFDEVSEFGRAARLYMRVKKERSILVILDDIWEVVKLEDVGIPFWDKHKGCKILLTSRFLDVLHQMDSQKEIEVPMLSEEEAWDLFKRKAGSQVENSEFQPIANQICKKCDGLPIAIVTVANALRKKGLLQWEIARDQLEGPQSAIELAFNHLETEEMKSAFLLFTLMPQNAFNSNLLKYGKDLNLFLGNMTLEEARNKLSLLLQGLKSADLLIESHSKDEFNMHDFVRDVAVSIAKRRGWLNGMADIQTLGTIRGLSLSHGELKSLLKGLELPQLKFLRIQNDDPAFRVPDDLFSKMKALEVLDSVRLQLPKLPSSLCLLKNLKTLSLESCSLEELCGIAELKKLEILSLYKSLIEKLPEEIGELAQLKLLNLNDCSQLQVIPPNVLSRLPNLEELYIWNSFTKWEPEDPRNQARKNVSIAELKDMTNLTALDMNVPDSHIIPKDLILEKLNRYNITIGDAPNSSGKHGRSRTLKLQLRERINLHPGIQMLLKKTEDLYLDELTGVKSILYDLDSEGFPQLKHLYIRNSMELRYIVNPRESFPPSAFPTLESLCLENLLSLEKLCKGLTMPQSFQNIRIIKVTDCHKLKNLLSYSVVKGLLHLKEIEVTNCRNMGEVVSSDLDMSDKIELSKLQTLTLDCLPQLISFNSGEKTHSFALFSQEVLLSNLEFLKLCSINATRIWHDQFLVVSLCTRNLTSMTLERCDGLRYVFRSTMIGSLQQLKHLEISECKLMEEIVYFDEIPNGERMVDMFFPILQTLKMKGLHKLVRFCSGDSVKFPCLKQLEIHNCPKLNRFMSKSKLESHNAYLPFFDSKVALPQLEKLMISHLKSLKMLCHRQLYVDSFRNLKAMEIEHCEELEKVFPTNSLDQFSSLEMLNLSDCRSVEILFDLGGLNLEDVDTLILNHPLKSLLIYRLPNLKSIWDKDPKGILNFQNLNSVDIFRCESLISVFPTSVARTLHQLERLEIDTCLSLEEVISREQAEIERRFEFPRLSFLKLWNLPEFKCFYPEIHSVWFPMLKRLKMYHCYQELSFIEQVLPNLEEVSLEAKMISLLSSRPLGENLFEKILKLQVHCFHHDSATLPLSFIQKFNHLENLEFGCSRFKNLFTFEGSIRLPQVRSLKLVALSYLEQIWREGSRPNLLLPNLESLWVWQSNSLPQIFPSSASFENLRILDIWECNRLTHIVGSSTARSLIHLIKMSIKECTMMAEIVADEEDEEEEEAEEVISFDSLKCLELHNLPSLVNFCSGNCGFSFPALEDVTVQGCPNLTTFSFGTLSTPKLKKVWLTEDKDQSYWRRDLNTTIWSSFGKTEFNGKDQNVREPSDSHSVMQS